MKKGKKDDDEEGSSLKKMISHSGIGMAWFSSFKLLQYCYDNEVVWRTSGAGFLPAREDPHLPINTGRLSGTCPVNFSQVIDMVWDQ